MMVCLVTGFDKTLPNFLPIASPPLEKTLLKGQILAV